MSLTILKLAGSIATMLLVFSLLTKTSPLSFAAAGAAASRHSSRNAGLRIAIGFIASPCNPSICACPSGNPGSALGSSPGQAFSGTCSRLKPMKGRGQAEGEPRMAGDESAPALLLDDVVKTYGAVRALDGVSLR